MMAAAALALAQAASPDEIVVIARKAREIKVDVKAKWREGKLVLDRCRVTRPAGYPEIDAVPCQAAAACADEGTPDFAALKACMESRAQPMFEAVLTRLREARP